MKPQKHSRIAKSFDDELEDIIKERVDNGTDKHAKYKTDITSMIPKHMSWWKIKRDLILHKFSKDKKALATAPIMEYLFIALFSIILIGIFVFMFILTNDALDQNIEIGQVNLQTVNAQTFGAINSAVVSHADLISVTLLFGMILGMFGTAYFMRGKYPRLMIIIDLFLLVVAFIIAVQVSNSYEILINSDALLDFFINDMPKASSFILNLPTIIGILGAIMIILSYSRIPREVSPDLRGTF